MKNDRFLIAIIAGIAAIAVLALVLFFTRRDQVAAYPADDTPEGVIAAFVMAIENKDWDRAYAYLADGENKVDLARFRQIAVQEFSNTRTAGVEIRSTQMNGDRADVELVVVNISGGLFSDIYRNPGVAVLLRQNGNWKISEMVYPFWSYNWYQPETFPTKP